MGLLTTWALYGLVAKWQRTFEIWCRKAGQIVVFLHLPNVFSFQSISSYIYFFFSVKPSSQLFVSLLLTLIILLFVKPLWYAENPLQKLTRNTLFSQNPTAVFSLCKHETYCKLRQQTPVTEDKKGSSGCWKCCVKASAEPVGAAVTTAPQQVFSAPRDVRRHYSGR